MNENDEHTYKELVKRDATFAIEIDAPFVSANALEQASRLPLFKKFMNSHSGVGFGTWLILEAQDALSKNRHHSTKDGKLYIYHASHVWLFELTKNRRTLISIAPTLTEVNNNQQPNVHVTLHAINRITTRFLYEFVAHGFLNGIGVVSWINQVLLGKTSELKHHKDTNYIVNVSGMSFILDVHEKYEVITVY